MKNVSIRKKQYTEKMQIANIKKYPYLFLILQVNWVIIFFNEMQPVTNHTKQKRE